MVGKETARALLTDERQAFIRGSIVGGLSDYDNPNYYSSAARRDHTARVRANNRNAHIVARARRAQPHLLGIRVAERRGRVLFVIDDRLCVSFKYLDRNRRSRNVPTRQAVAFLDQRPLALDLPPVMTNIIAGYQLDSLEQRCQIVVTCPHGRSNAWEWELTGQEQLSFFSDRVDLPVQDMQVGRVVLRAGSAPNEAHNEDIAAPI